MNEIYAPGDIEFEFLVERLSERLSASGRKMACAESCTGGWIAKICTDRAGSSDWFDRGYVTYSNEAKEDQLGVNAATLAEAGAVSREVALQMASGARERAAVDVSVAVTGIAGPDGGTEDKPVGTVWFAWSLDGITDAEVCRFKGGRDAIRRQSVAYALQGLIDRMES